MVIKVPKRPLPDPVEIVYIRSYVPEVDGEYLPQNRDSEPSPELLEDFAEALNRHGGNVLSDEFVDYVVNNMMSRKARELRQKRQKDREKRERQQREQQKQNPST